MQKVLSIVIPTYNIEAYLGKCLDSFVVTSVLPEIEVLVVNDGSTDGSLAIAQEYEKRYPDSIRVIDKKNGGHGSTINTGTKEAAGHYFKVVDGDDWVDRVAFEELVQFLKSTEADLVSSNYYWVDHTSGKKTVERRTPFTGVAYEKVYAFEEISGHTVIKMHALTIRTEVLRQNPYSIDEHCFYVDMEYILFPIPYVKTVVFLDLFVYMYRIGLGTQSMNLKNMQRNRAHYEKVFSRLLDFYEINRTEQRAEYILNYLERNIATMVGGYYKILISLPLSVKVKREMQEFDHMLKQRFPAIYHAVTSRPVRYLRRTAFLLYYPLHCILKIKMRT
ncbi:MAG: glycosyltransferase family 2 protein [Lachnospiraceae bacterium]